MWQAFPNNRSPKLWVDENSSLKTAFALYNPYTKLPRLIKSIVQSSPKFIGNLLLKPVNSNKQIERFNIYKSNIDRILGVNSTINISPGTKSKHQKTTIQITNNNVTECFLKASDNSETIELSKNEFCILKYLETKDLSFLTPRALFGDFVDTTYYLIQSAPSSQFKQSEKSFETSHEQVLIELFDIGRTTFDLSKHIATVHDIIKNSSYENTGVILSSLDAIGNKCDNIEANYALSHGDFSPWNILINKDRKLFIFDWEHGNKQAPLLFDFFHFHYMVSKLLDQSQPEDIERYINSLFYVQKYKNIFTHMNISKYAYDLYFKLYMVAIIIREINENEQPSIISVEVFKNLRTTAQ